VQDQNSRPPRGRDNDRITLTIPAGLGETLDQQLLELRQTIAETPRREQRTGARLRAVEALRDQLAWDERHPDETIQLTAERWLLDSMVHGSIVWIGDRIAHACHQPAGAGFSVEDIQARQQQLAALLDLQRATSHAQPA